MSRDYVIINGKNSLEVQGLAIKLLPPISKPTMRTIREEIDGRDGDIVTNLGYQAYDKAMEIGLFGTYDINDVIAFFNSEGTIVFSDESDKYYNFKILDKIDYTALIKFRTATITIHCQPFKYPLNETPLVEEYEYVEATGTNLTLDNTSEAIFNKIELQGNTFQQTYTGKNKIPTSDTISTTGTTSNGITFTLLSDGTIKANGTATAGVSIYLTNDWLVFPAGTYTISDGIASGQSGTTFFLFADVQHSSGSAWDEKYFSTAGSFTRQIEETFRFRPRIVVRQGQTLNNLIFKPQLEASSTSTEYEPYVGGIPSPSPDYPEPIHVVTGDNTIEITGRNLLNLEAFVKGRINNTTGNIEYANNVSSMVIGENNISFVVSQAWNSGITSDFIPISTGNYVFKYGHNREITMAIDTYDSQKKKIARIDAFTQTQTPTTRTYTISDSNVKYIRIHFEVNTANVEYIVSEMQLEKGSTSTTYEPYTGETYPLNLGVPNLIKETEATLGTISQSDGVTIGSSTSVYYIPSYINVKPNEAYSFKYNGTSNITIRAFYYNASKTYLSTAVVSGSSSNQVTFTIPTNAYYLRVQYGSGYYNQGLQLTKGSTPQTISNTPLEMASIPNTTYKDLFVKENDTWYKRQVINKQIFNGDSSMLWGVNSNWDTTAPALLHIFTNSLNDLWKQGQSGFLCDHFICTTEAQRDFAKEMVTCHTTNTTPYFFIKYDRLTGVTSTSPVAEKITAFNNWLGSNNTELLYLAAEETDIEITNETLIEQLEDIWNATSYRGQTNITQVSNDLPFMMEVSALKLGSDHLEINNTGNIYSKPTIELEGTGIVDIYLNDVQVFEVDLSEENKITIDTEKMEAYTDTGLANRKVTGDYSTFKLNVGTNDLRFSGALTSATITRYLRWL